MIFTDGFIQLDVITQEGIDNDEVVHSIYVTHEELSYHWKDTRQKIEKEIIDKVLEINPNYPIKVLDYYLVFVDADNNYYRKLFYSTHRELPTLFMHIVDED